MQSQSSRETGMRGATEAEFKLDYLSGNLQQLSVGIDDACSRTQHGCKSSCCLGDAIDDCAKSTALANGRISIEQFKLQQKLYSTFYLFVIPATYFVAYFHLHSVSLAHAAAGPIFLSAVGAWRMRRYIHAQDAEVTVDFARKEIAAVSVLSVVMGLTMSAWALSMTMLADQGTQNFTIAYIALCSIAGALCLGFAPVPMFMTLFLPTVMCLGFGLLHEGGAEEALIVCFLGISLMMYRTAMTNLGVLCEMVESTVKVELQKHRLLEARAESDYAARHDFLTGLRNRRSFDELMNRATAESSGNGDQQLSISVVGLLDLDEFKEVNDLHGHATGDLLLVQVADEIKRIAGSKAEVFRLGGDEFGLLFKERNDIEMCVELARAIVSGIETIRRVEGFNVNITGSVGLADAKCRVDLSEVVKEADLALYKAKSKGTGSLFVYSSDMKTDQIRRIYIAQNLRNPAAIGGLTFEFQPIVSRRTGRTVAVEALARWFDPQYGQIGPGEFIPLAEHLGLMPRLGDELLRRLMQEIGPRSDDVRIAVNISAKIFADPTFVDRLYGYMDEFGVGGRNIEIEVTETAVLRAMDRAATTIEALQSRGITVSLDDFGAGYSSFSVLARLGFNKLKIDRSVILDVETSERSRKVLWSICSMGRDLGIGSVVEGVETQEQFEIASKCGCDEVQGYWLAKPSGLATCALQFDQVASLSGRVVPMISAHQNGKIADRYLGTGSEGI